VTPMRPIGADTRLLRRMEALRSSAVPSRERCSHCHGTGFVLEAVEMHRDEDFGMVPLEHVQSCPCPCGELARRGEAAAAEKARTSEAGGRSFHGGVEL